MTYQSIIYSTEDGIARITLNRPEKHNALNHQLIDDLNAAFEALEDDEEVSVVVLSGAGRSFCSGYDLKGSYYLTPPDPSGEWTPNSALAALKKLEGFYRRIWNCPKVTIAQEIGGLGAQFRYHAQMNGLGRVLPRPEGTGGPRIDR
jgi:enoyl-CoA hydratase